MLSPDTLPLPRPAFHCTQQEAEGERRRRRRPQQQQQQQPPSRRPADLARPFFLEKEKNFGSEDFRSLFF